MTYYRLQSRVDRLERECGRLPGPCPLCERRERTLAPAAIPGTREEIINTVTWDCPRCGRPFTFNVVYVDWARPGHESAIQT